jgi:hypothetical protein
MRSTPRSDEFFLFISTRAAEFLLPPSCPSGTTEPFHALSRARLPGLIAAYCRPLCKVPPDRRNPRGNRLPGAGFPFFPDK